MHPDPPISADVGCSLEVGAHLSSSLGGPRSHSGPPAGLAREARTRYFYPDAQQRPDASRLDQTQNLGAGRETSISGLKITLGLPGLRSNLELTP